MNTTATQSAVERPVPTACADLGSQPAREQNIAAIVAYYESGIKQMCIRDSMRVGR